MRLGQIITYQKGKSPQKGSDSNNLALYLSPEYLRGKSQPNYVPDFPIKVKVDDGDLLLLWDGSNAGEFFRARKGLLSSTMVKLSFDEKKFNRDFLYYQLKEFEGFLKSQTNGSGIPHVDKDILLGLEVEEFKPEEQTGIAEILSTADRAREQTEALIAKYQRIKTGLMQDLLTRGIDEHGNIRSKATHKFVIENGMEVPEGWEVVELAQLIENRSAICYGIVQVLKHTEGGVPTIAIKDMCKNYENLHLTDCKIEEMYKRSRVRNGDLLISVKGTTGRIDVVPTGFAGNISRDIAKIRLSIDCNPNFYKFFLDSEMGQHLIDSISVGSTRKEISIQPLKKMRVIKPGLSEQNKITLQISEIDRFLKTEIERLYKLQLIKAGLMQDLLSGKVRVNTSKLCSIKEEII